ERRKFSTVVSLPGAEASHGRIEIVEAPASPELFLVNPVTPSDLAVLLWAARLDVPMPDSPILHGKREGKGTPCPLSHCSFRIRKGKARQISVRKARLELWCSRR